MHSFTEGENSNIENNWIGVGVGVGKMRGIETRNGSLRSEVEAQRAKQPPVSDEHFQREEDTGAATTYLPT